MGNIMAGLALDLLGVIVLIAADIFIRYPANLKAPPRWPYLAARSLGYLLLGIGFVIVLSGFF